MCIKNNCIVKDTYKSTNCVYFWLVLTSTMVSLMSLFCRTAALLGLPTLYIFWFFRLQLKIKKCIRIFHSLQVCFLPTFVWRWHWNRKLIDFSSLQLSGDLESRYSSDTVANHLPIHIRYLQDFNISHRIGKRDTSQYKGDTVSMQMRYSRDADFKYLVCQSTATPQWVRTNWKQILIMLLIIISIGINFKKWT